MEEMFARRLAEARRAGASRQAHVWCRELSGLLGLAISERWRRAGPANRLRPGYGGHEPGHDFSHSSARMRRQQRIHSGPKAGIMDTTAQEIRQAARRLVRTPVFTLTAALTLALAIAANASIFTVVHRVVMNPLPYPDSGRLIALDYGFPARNQTSGLTSMAWQLYYQLADHARTLEGVAVYFPAAATLSGGGIPERIRVTRATPSLVSVLRVSPALGRWFTEAEGESGAAPVAVLSHGLWMRRFGGDRTIVGRPVPLDGVPTEVVGVMPASFSFPDQQTELWTVAQSTRARASFLFSLNGIARLRDDATVESARTEITALIADLSRRVPNQTGMVSAAVPLQDMIVGRIASALWILLASAGLVLLVACANVANLFLVRSETRQREVAVRRALGAGNRGVARYFFTESALLALIGGALGLMLAWGGVRLLVAFGPVSLPRLNEIRIDGVVLAFSLGLSFMAAVAFGTIPLLRLTPLAMTLHENGRGQTATRGSHRARQLLMAGQVALALILLVASGLMVRSFQKLRAVDPGFDPTSALTFSIGLPQAGYPSRQAAVDVHLRILDRLSAIPGVTGTASSTCLPLAGGCFGNGMRIEGEVPDPTRPPRAWVFFRAVGGNYSDVMGMKLLRGRPSIAEISSAANRRHREPGVCRRVLSRSGSNWPARPFVHAADFKAAIAFVADHCGSGLRHALVRALGTGAVPQLHMPMSIAGGPDIPRESLIGPDTATTNYVVRSATPSSDLVAAVHTAIDDVDPNLAIAQVRTLQDIVDRASDQMTFTMVLLAIAAGVALLLGAIGIYGVVSYIVTQRTGEIRVRLAMGAEPAASPA